MKNEMKVQYIKFQSIYNKDVDYSEKLNNYSNFLILKNNKDFTDTYNKDVDYSQVAENYKTFVELRKYNLCDNHYDREKDYNALSMALKPCLAFYGCLSEGEIKQDSISSARLKQLISFEGRLDSVDLFQSPGSHFSSDTWKNHDFLPTPINLSLDVCKPLEPDEASSYLATQSSDSLAPLQAPTASRYPARMQSSYSLASLQPPPGLGFCVTKLGYHPLQQQPASCLSASTGYGYPTPQQQPASCLSSTSYGYPTPQQQPASCLSSTGYGYSALQQPASCLSSTSYGYPTPQQQPASCLSSTGYRYNGSLQSQSEYCKFPVGYNVAEATKHFLISSVPIMSYSCRGGEV